MIALSLSLIKHFSLSPKFPLGETVQRKSSPKVKSFIVLTHLRLGGRCNRGRLRHSTRWGRRSRAPDSESDFGLRQTSEPWQTSRRDRRTPRHRSIDAWTSAPPHRNRFRRTATRTCAGHQSLPRRTGDFWDRSRGPTVPDNRRNSYHHHFLCQVRERGAWSSPCLTVGGSDVKTSTLRRCSRWSPCTDDDGRRTPANLNTIHTSKVKTKVKTKIKIKSAGNL